jgi:hypothetical protein
LVAYLALRPALAPLPAADAALGARIGRALRAREEGFRQQALTKFPGDPWSQNDHFGTLERDFVRTAAAREQIRTGSVLEAIDRDVRAAPDAAPQRGWVPPCMPRPFYD